MTNKLLKELQAKFKTAVRESKALEKEHVNVQPDLMETNEDSETIGMPHTLPTQDSSNEVTNLSQVSFLKRKLQKQFKEASRDSKDEKENREKAFEPITRELIQIKETVKGDSQKLAVTPSFAKLPLAVSSDTHPLPLSVPSSSKIVHPSIGPNELVG